jgi:hypothetical protein
MVACLMAVVSSIPDTAARCGGVGVVGEEGFLELPVDAEPFEGGGGATA